MDVFNCLHLMLGTVSINDYANFMQLFFLKVFHLNNYIWVCSLRFRDDLLWQGIRESKLNVDLSQEPSRAKLLAAHDASVLKDTGIKKKYYFIKSHSTASLALVLMCFSVKSLLVSEEPRQTLCLLQINRISQCFSRLFKLLKQELWMQKCHIIDRLIRVGFSQAKRIFPMCTF